jgi:hypothetical protein
VCNFLLMSEDPKKPRKSFEVSFTGWLLGTTFLQGFRWLCGGVQILS